ncbi:hypothetical protein Q5P01_000094 [Channa striata]|uniref:Uncharacterized protein n=1 Tax=Channa striata TaxID=64152 RepID=A0AA88IK37_CHASR|nr:hypothetical protein Q5P01_000094 [Channa striata]
MNFKTPRASPWLKVAIAWTLLSLLLVLSLSHEACASRDATPLGGDGSDPAGDGEITERRVVLRPGCVEDLALSGPAAYLVYHFSLARVDSGAPGGVFRYPNCSRAACEGLSRPERGCDSVCYDGKWRDASAAVSTAARDYGRALREVDSAFGHLTAVVNTRVGRNVAMDSMESGLPLSHSPTGRRDDGPQGVDRGEGCGDFDCAQVRGHDAGKQDLLAGQEHVERLAVRLQEPICDRRGLCDPLELGDDTLARRRQAGREVSSECPLACGSPCRPALLQARIELV